MTRNERIERLRATWKANCSDQRGLGALLELAIEMMDDAASESPHFNRERFHKISDFLGPLPTQHYAREVTHALDCFFDMFESLVSVQCNYLDLLPEDLQRSISNAVENARRF